MKLKELLAQRRRTSAPTQAINQSNQAEPQANQQEIKLPCFWRFPIEEEDYAGFF